MKRIFIILLVLNSAIFAQDTQSIRVKSDISSAIVYLDGAEVVRSKTVDLKQGKNELVFEGLSDKLNPKTIQVYAPEGVDILSITNKINYLQVEEGNPHIKILNDSIALLEKQIRENNNERSAYSAERDLLMHNISLGGQNNGVQMAELREAATFFRTRNAEINNKITSIDYENQKLTAALQKQYNQLQELNGQNNIVRSEITILLSAANAVKAPVEIRYLVSEVGWIPAYDIKATEINEPIQLIYRAKVYNNSGIDWKNVKIKLSSADPNLSASKPVLDAWYLGYHQTQNAPQNAYLQQGYDKKMPVMNLESMADAPSAFEPAPQLNTFQKGALTFTNIAVSDINAEFEIADKYSIPSDAKPYFIKIKEYELKADFKHYSIPKLSCDAYLLARITGWEDLDILEGTANIYLNGTFTGQSFIDTRNVSDTLDLSLGRDNKVVIHRNKQKEFSSTKLIGSNKKETFAYEIVVKNNHKVPVQIEIIDQLPVPQDSDIEVDKIQLSEAQHNELSGTLTWNKSIAPGEVKKIDLSFAIKYPKNRPVNTRNTKFRQVRFF